MSGGGRSPQRTILWWNFLISSELTGKFLELALRICAYFNIIWDEAEELQALAQLSHPRVTVDTAGLSPEATELANRLAERIEKLDAETVRRMLQILDGKS